MTPQQIERKARRVLRTNGLAAGKRYAAKRGYTLPSAMLKTAALRWERARWRASIRKKYGRLKAKLLFMHGLRYGENV